MKREGDRTEAQVALAVSNHPVGPLAGVIIDGRGYSRARFIFQFAAAATTAAISSAGGTIFQTSAATSSSGAYTSIAAATLTAISSGVISAWSGSGGVLAIVDTVLANDAPWLKISGLSVLSTAIVMGCVVELYNGINRPSGHALQQQIVVN